MNIPKIAAAPSFCETVHMDKVKIAKEIAKIRAIHDPHMELKQIESLIGNVNTLKERLQNETPDECAYTIDLELIRDDKSSKSNPATDLRVNVSEDTYGRNYKSKALLAYIDPYKLYFSSGQRIWEDGFKEITDKALYEAGKSDAELNPVQVMSDRENNIFDRLV